MASVSDSGATGDSVSSDFVLANFTPYRVVVLGDVFSRALARHYKDADISIAEWRVLAVIGGAPNSTKAISGMAARDVVLRTPMDKMAVSRAVAGLEEKTLVIRKPDPHDRRVSKLFLSPQGRKLFDRIVDIAVSFEERLLSVLSHDERQNFFSLLTRLETQAAEEFGFGRDD